MNINHHIEAALDQLKDFQKKTVEYAVERFSSGQNRILIADEVGLGKTIVAKGIIAKLYQQKYRNQKSFSVVYICSNKALARQNLSKLSIITKLDKDDRDADRVIDYSEEDDRITALAYEPKAGPNKYRLNIKALTPATSFDNKTHAGKADERVLLYRLISGFDEFKQKKIALKWFLQGGNRIGAQTWVDKISFAERFCENNQDGARKIKNDIPPKFYRKLKEKLSYSYHKSIYSKLGISKEISILNILETLLESNKQNRTFVDCDKNGSYLNKEKHCFNGFSTLISELRYQLSIVCKDYLHADLFILDEFQRYSNLIKAEDGDDDPGTFLAKSVFSKSKVKVLMLSATPFKTYTNSFDELQGENHFQEFRSVLKFLLKDKEQDFWDLLDKENSEYFKIISTLRNNEETLKSVNELKNKIEAKYRSCIARTERNLVESPTEDCIDSSVKLMKINKHDIEDFISADEIVIALERESSKKLPIPVEYVKSSPFPFSFLKDYEHMRVLEEEYEHNTAIKKAVAKTKRAWLSEDRIKAYKALLPESEANKENEPNAKLRMLYNETVRNKGWQLLWIPSSIPYYNPTKGAFVNASNFTKTLIFSAWKMVPKMVSALVSYEAERLSIGRALEQRKETNHQYDDKRRYPYPLLTFKNTDGRLSGMNNLMLAYPSEFLARIYHPASNLIEKKTLGEVKKTISKVIKARLIELNITSIGSASGDLQKWEWYALILLDKHESHEGLNKWVQNQYDPCENQFENEDEKLENGASGKKNHFEEVRRCLIEPAYIPNVGKLKEKQLDDLCNHLTDLCLGSPAVCCLRSFRATYSAGTTEHDLFHSSYKVGTGFLSLFNKPESIAIVNEFEDAGAYHKKVVNYGINGNIQAMLDEFVYQLQESSGITGIEKCADFIRDILTVNAGNVDVKTLSTIGKNNSNTVNIRSHYAISFGIGSNAELKNGTRQIKVREAFNSPFRPFVLTSTSIGQEGLDFHFYCSKLIHWNLPHNPIDLEQREGRIKRFKGLNIRRKIADTYSSLISETIDSKNIWELLFLMAEKHKPADKCDLIPFWHMDGNEIHDIETIIPIYQYSKDLEKVNYIKMVLGNYRLTFGQPRQEELIYILGGIEKNLENRRLLKDLCINLCPICY